MTFEIPKIPYTGKIPEVILGQGDMAVAVGGETSYPFYLFEGEMPHPPRIAMTVYDTPPEDWPEAVAKPFENVLGDPVAWAQQVVRDCGAEIICLKLASIDPNGLNRGAQEAANLVKRVAENIDVPLIIWGCDSPEKNEQVLRVVQETVAGRNLVIGPVVEANYKKLGALALGYHHTVIASTSIDINLAKQLNILLGNLGVEPGRTLMDPTVGALGYGIEYTYSVMERMRMAALVQQDAKLQLPIICNLASEVWKIKEARISASEAPALGDPAQRGVLIEAITAVLMLLAGGDVLVMVHPEAVTLVREIMVDLMA